MAAGRVQGERGGHNAFAMQVPRQEKLEEWLRSGHTVTV